MKSFIVCILMPALLFTAGCVKKMTCIPEPVVITFVGYAEEEVKLVQVKWYEKGSSYGTLKDTAICNIAGWNDTQGGFTSCSLAGDKEMNALSDLEIYIPSANRSYRISDMKSEGTKEKRIVDDSQNQDKKCFDRITEYDLDGSHVDNRPLGPSGPAYYGMEVELKK